MKRTFVNCVWGVYKDESGYLQDTHWYQRRSKVANDVVLHLKNPYVQPTIVYVFGSENYKKMVDLGFTCKLVDKRPYVYDMVAAQYTHKLLVWKLALEEYDSIVFTDFDCIPLRPLPIDFWDKLDSGDPIKSSIYMYRLKRVFSRKYKGQHDTRKTSGANWVYMRKEIGSGVLDWWDSHGKHPKEEIPLSEYIDSRHGGWQGPDFYRDTHEPIYQCNYNDYPQEWMNKYLVPDISFAHINLHTVAALLGKDDRVKERIDSCYKGYIEMIKSSNSKNFTLRW